MRLAAGAGWLCILVVLACARGEERLRLPWPDPSEAQSAIFVLHRPEGLDFFAADLSTPPKLIPDGSLGAGSPTMIELLLYDEPLSELGLAPGPVPLDPSGLPVPSTERVWASTWDGQVVDDWSSASMSASVLAASIARDPRSLCASFTVERAFDIGAAKNNAFGMYLGPDRALVGSQDGKFLYLDVDGGRAIADLPVGLPTNVGAVDASGALWFGGARGELWRGELQVLPQLRIEATWVTTTSSAQELSFILVETEPELVIHAIGDRGAWERYAHGQWERVYNFGGGTGGQGGLASSEPGVVYAATGARAQILRYEDGRVEDVAPPDLLDGITGLGRVDGAGLVFSAGQGRLYIENGPRAWRPVPNNTLNLFIYTFMSFRGAFLMGGALGFVAEYRPQSGLFCPAEQLGAGSVRALLPLSQGVLVAEDVPISRARGVTTLLRAR